MGAHEYDWPRGVGHALELRFPQLSNGELTRTRLLRRLAGKSEAPFVLLSAPLGYGKSTLLTQWCSSQERTNGSTARTACTAVALNSRDNDPAVFCSRIFQAILRAFPDIGCEVRPHALTAARPEARTTTLHSLVAQVGQHGGRLALALDDYHEITEPECQAQLAYLVDHLPPGSRLAVATRSDPPLPLARLRTLGAVTELRMPDLGFSPEEAGQLVHHITGAPLSPRHLDMLMERTEGWPAIVHLVARLLRAEPDPGAFLRRFGGADRYVVDFLDEEVLRHLRPDQLRFLTRTSVLDRFTAGLCEAVTGQPGAVDMLDHAERANLFVVPLDSVRGWYRYHRLAGQALRERLTRCEPGSVVAELHRRACAWYDRHDRWEPAIRHALAAGQPAHAVRLVERHWNHQLCLGRLDTVRDWLDTLGEHAVAHNPPAALCAAWVTALSGQRLASRRWLRAAHPPRPEALLYQATFGFDGLDQMLAAARTATELFTEPTAPPYGQARLALGFSQYLRGELDAAAAPLGEAIQTTDTLPVPHVQALAVLSLVTGERGRAGQARDLARAALDRARAEGLADGFAGSTEITLAWVADAVVQARQGQLHAARDTLERALRPRRAAVGLPPWPTVTALVPLARVLLASGEHAGAQAVIGETGDVLRGVPGGAAFAHMALSGVARRLTAAQRSTVRAPAPRSPNLTEREATVLRLLRSSLPLREIAGELFVTVNTVKSHTRLIYRKLGVSSRAEAVRRGRELGLV